MVGVQTATIGAGYVALFRVTNWSVTQDWEYRVAWAQGTTQQAFYTGMIKRNPTREVQHLGGDGQLHASTPSAT